MSLVNTLAKFARTPQGRKMAQQAVRAASDPKTKRQIAGLRQKLAQRGTKR